jgi:hypothetical protein
MDKSKQAWLFDSTEAKIIKHRVHTIYMGDVDDPDLMVAHPIWEWQQTDAGKYVMKNSVPAPSWHRYMDTLTYGYQYAIVAYFTPEQLTYWKLKFE